MYFDDADEELGQPPPPPPPPQLTCVHVPKGNKNLTYLVVPFIRSTASSGKCHCKILASLLLSLVCLLVGWLAGWLIGCLVFYSPTVKSLLST